MQLIGKLLKPLVLITPWFGRWPAWIDFYFKSCRRNGDIDWLVISDQDKPSGEFENIRFIKTSVDECFSRIGAAAGLDLGGLPVYKINDFKPCLGLAYQDEIEGYGHFGYVDADIIFGRINKFYSRELLNRYDILSTHEQRFSGHFTVIRNTNRMRNAYRKVKKWRDLISRPENTIFDERKFFRRFKPLKPRLLRQLNPSEPRLYLKEQFSTVDALLDGEKIMIDWPRQWFWRKGVLTAGKDAKEYLYLHFSRWQSDRWLHGSPAPWAELRQIASVSLREARERGFMISPTGFEPLPEARSSGRSASAAVA